MMMSCVGFEVYKFSEPPLLAQQFFQSPPFGCLKIFGAPPQYFHPPLVILNELSLSNAEKRRLFKAYPYLASLTLPCRKVHQFKNVLFCTAERGHGFPRGRSKRVFSVMRDLSDIIGWAVLTVFP